MVRGQFSGGPSPLDKCLHTTKFPSKIIGPTQANSSPKSTASELKKIMHCLRVLYIRVL